MKTKTTKTKNNKFTLLILGLLIGIISLGSAFAISGNEFKNVNKIPSGGGDFSASLWNNLINQIGDITDAISDFNSKISIVSGKVGIGTNTPQMTLSVSGGVQVGGDNLSCNQNLQKTLRYNASLGIMEYCNGNQWTSILSGDGVDNIPDSVDFGSVTASLGGATYTSSTVLLSGFDGTINVSCPNCKEISKNGIWMTGVNVISGFIPGDSLTLRVTSSLKSKTTVTGTVVIGNTTSNFIVRTADFVCGERITDPRGGGMDGNGSYDTIQVGTQCWMRQNMNVGTRLDVGANPRQTNNSIIEKCCYNNDENICGLTPNSVYPDGGLYQWAEAVQYAPGPGCTASNTAPCQPTYPVKGICPDGFHIPNDTEWYTLENYLKDSGQSCDPNRINSWTCNSAGTKLKTGGSSGLEFNLAGLAYVGGNGLYRPSDGFYWSSTEYSSNVVLWRKLNSGAGTITRSNENDKAYGGSVRCIKD